MKTTAKQRAKLRSLSNRLETILQTGKNGLSDPFIKTVDDALEARELIKIKVLENCPQLPREMAYILAEKVGAEVVSTVGSRFVLFRQARDPKKRKISLELD